ncbi:protein of unknown function [Bradyrhizobium sp. ORS 285]|nr:hypothetical protein BRAO285_850069 [Bradyrhizobium sp. ORS 285]SMX61510.1 protein of unknown function [Bradyrhizobium sp. ORS 285]
MKSNPVFRSLRSELDIPNAEPLRILRRRAQKSKRLKCPRPSKIPTQYKAYIKSVFWSERRERYFRKHGKRCAVCRTTEGINLHHKVYGNYGSEPDADLMPLCGRHHIGFHTQHGVKRDMRADTAEYVHGAAFEEEAERVMRSI